MTLCERGDHSSYTSRYSIAFSQIEPTHFAPTSLISPCHNKQSCIAGRISERGPHLSDLHYSVAPDEAVPAGLPSRKLLVWLPSNLDEAFVAAA
jgi:hypothetical protein